MQLADDRIKGDTPSSNLEISCSIHQKRNQNVNMNI